MPTDDDAALARLLDQHVDDLLTLLGDWPEDQVKSSVVASMRQSVDRVLASADDTALRTAAGLLVDVVWWMHTSSDEDLDEWGVGNLLESSAAFLQELPDDRRHRLIETLDALAAAEPHDTRRYELRSFAYAMGLRDTEPAEPEPLARAYVKPEDR
ncbi:hypothetical protein GCM10010168_18380 [Actinoplanes ianthinogenes]|uniref:Uncharacterized protein n=1 Tax=Actinoplanes ianthinogenes TaxID=122358 RepID=A0ABM7M7A3_9ACTN|nr:hypothetical protein [Actinoplanes ianthinogenes]BCJ47480.1 hypothetical protein Aiant_81370 [Actinoplanes ianthinogenes]GGR02054.1 hypothetical protein GCM10010168_18380 [Actinoplanes ianthinogenes]